jgi:pimeloyl-ACP methyl ester carboxylesterase
VLPTSRIPVSFLPGLGGSSKSFSAVFRLLKPFERVCLYDRSGFGQSEPSPDKLTSTTIVSELDLLLKNAGIEPPYIFVGHSWGGLLSREFYASHPDDVEGMFLIDSNQEHTLVLLDWTEEKLWAIAGKVDWYESTGQNREHRMTEEEWQPYKDDQASKNHLRQKLKERKTYASSFTILLEKAQLHRRPEPLMGDRPFSVVMGCQHQDWQRIYDAATEKGYHGTEEEQKFYQKFLTTDLNIQTKLQKELLTLSRNSRFVAADNSGHDVQIFQPEVIANEVKWVLEEVRNAAVQPGLSHWEINCGHF